MPGDFPDAETAARLKEAGTAYGQDRRVKGSCPACYSNSLFLGEGGHVTCSNVSCHRPTLAAEVLGASVGGDEPSIAERATEPAEAALRRVATELVAAREVIADYSAEVQQADARAKRAEDRCVRTARGVDARDRHARELIAALNQFGPPPWWVTATRALDSLESLAESAQLVDDGATEGAGAKAITSIPVPPNIRD